MGITGGMSENRRFGESLYAKGPLKYCGYCKELSPADDVKECEKCGGDVCPNCNNGDEFANEVICENCWSMYYGKR